MLGAVYGRLQTLGTLLVFGAMSAPDESTASPEGDAVDPAAPVWTYFRDQAQRCGFELVRACTADGVEPEQGRPKGPRTQPGQATVQSVLAVFRKARSAPRWRLSTIETGDASLMRTLFDEVFAPNRMTAEHWQWKYGDKRGVAVGAWSGSDLVAHYGGVWRGISLQGRPAMAVQITDVMVAQRQRGILRRDGAFFLAAASFPECFTGYGAKALVGFGFPNERHFKAAALRGLYGEADRMVEIAWPAIDSPPCDDRMPLAITRLDEVGVGMLARNGARITHLWHGMRRGLSDSIVGVRDWAYVAHRYLDNPIKRYRYAILRCPHTGTWLSLAVLAPESDGLHLRDAIGAPQHIPALIASIRGCAIGQGLPLKAWITASQAYRFPVQDAAIHDLGIVVPHSIWTAGPPLESVQGRWWLTSGDTDFL